MKLRDIGIEWHSQELGLTLWLHPGSHFGKINLVTKELDRLLGEKTNGNNKTVFRDLFVVADAFVLDYEYTSDESLPLVDYFKQKSLFDIESNLLMFMTALEYDDIEFLYEAFNATRVKPDTPDDEASEDTKKKKQTSEDSG